MGIQKTQIIVHRIELLLISVVTTMQILIDIREMFRACIKHNMQWISLDFIVQVVDVEHECSNHGYYEPKNLNFSKTVIFYFIYSVLFFLITLLFPQVFMYEKFQTIKKLCSQ
jgi:hypothetical protein